MEVAQAPTLFDFTVVRRNDSVSKGSLDLIPLDIDTISPETLEPAISVRLRGSRIRVKIRDIDHGTGEESSLDFWMETPEGSGDESWSLPDPRCTIVSVWGSMEQSDYRSILLWSMYPIISLFTGVLEMFSFKSIPFVRRKWDLTYKVIRGINSGSRDQVNIKMG